MDDIYTTLEAEYCPPLDTALLSAILSDYDLGKETDVRSAREALDPLKESALLEEQLGFDPSGTGAQDHGADLARRPESCPETSENLSRETDLTSLSTDLSSLDLDRRSEGGSILGDNDIARELEKQDNETKIQLLEQIVDGRVSQSQIAFTLKKCNGGFERALDELLNHVHFGGSGENGTKILAKGIDAFSEENTVRRGRKGKARKKAPGAVGVPRSGSLPSSPLLSSPSTSNAWQDSKNDIEFIATRMGLDSATVGPKYHKCGASIPKTIGELLKTKLTEGNEAIEEDPIKAVNAHELHLEFPSLRSDYVAALVSVTYPSTAAAHELAKALTYRPVERGGIEIVPIYERPDREALGIDTARTVSKASRHSGSTTPSEDIDVAQRASAYASARSAALAQAFAAHRKAKSDRLMGGAAAYYGQQYRNLTALSTAASAAVADQRAASQSTSNQLDLHGIDVRNAVRIVEQRVDQWWDSLGEDRANGRIGASNRHAGYEVVVGRGTHSEGGRSKLGPAVSKALKNAGWKIELDGPVIVVKGRARA
ncbi:Smr domain-containing protein [Pseudocercospora fuligena]|uniref:Smr domain-containing protein n=1 Tax=Pseudocercospora fuligena TaxID=685502 RepID=A0A8H6RF11_9PEZI|nr:Smr domain-containing protein [Pseudocercospora fuligena]